MAHPLLVASALLLGGAFAGNAFAEAKQRQREADAARERALGQATVDLEQGKPYAVMIEVNPQSPQWGGVRDQAGATSLIQQTMQQLGWQFSAAGVLPRSATDVASLQGGRPSQWVFTGVWRGAGRTMPPAPITPTWVGMALATPLPSNA